MPIRRKEPGTGKNRFFDFRSILKSEHGDSILAQIVFGRFDLIEIDFSDFFNYYSNHSSIQRNMICPSRVSHCNVERLASRDFRTERSSMDFCAFCLWEESLAHVGCGSYESRVHIIVITFRCFLLFLHIPSTFPDFNASELAISVGGNCSLESLSFSFFKALFSAEVKFNSHFLFLQCWSLTTPCQSAGIWRDLNSNSIVVLFLDTSRSGIQKTLKHQRVTLIHFEFWWLSLSFTSTSFEMFEFNVSSLMMMIFSCQKRWGYLRSPSRQG